MPLVHAILGAASGSWTVTPIVPYLAYFYCTDKGRECISRGAPLAVPSLTPHNPNISNVYPDYVQYRGDPSGFSRALLLLNDWNKKMEHNNEHRYVYAIQRT
jgi:hypothetical protein